MILRRPVPRPACCVLVLSHFCLGLYCCCTLLSSVYRYTSSASLYALRCGPERGTICVAQHALLVAHVRSIVRALVLTTNVHNLIVREIGLEWDRP